MIWEIILTVAITVAVIDLYLTFKGRPLIGPGPITKFLYPEIDRAESIRREEEKFKRELDEEVFGFLNLKYQGAELENAINWYRNEFKRKKE